MADDSRVIIGIDAGTSVIKAVAFEIGGRQLAWASARNNYVMAEDGAATQSLAQTWQDCLTALRGLAEKLPGLARRTAAIAVTGQGDGTWPVTAIAAVRRARPGSFSARPRSAVRQSCQVWASDCVAAPSFAMT